MEVSGQTYHFLKENYFESTIVCKLYFSIPQPIIKIFFICKVHIKGYFKLLLLVPITQFYLSAICARFSIHRTHMCYLDRLSGDRVVSCEMGTYILHVSYIGFMQILFQILLITLFRWGTPCI